jgi:hypothetical protein
MRSQRACVRGAVCGLHGGRRNHRLPRLQIVRNKNRTAAAAAAAAQSGSVSSAASVFVRALVAARSAFICIAAP